MAEAPDESPAQRGRVDEARADEAGSDEDWVEVVHATTERQRIVRLPRAPGMTAGEAVQRSGLLDGTAGTESGAFVLGIFGTRVAADRTLEARDRVEICRRLKTDPRQMRRAFMADGRVMGGAGGSQAGVKKSDSE